MLGIVRVLTLAQASMYSEEMAHRASWGKFINWMWGMGKNTEDDKAQGICNFTSKRVVQGMGSNKTRNVIIAASKVAPGIHEIK